MEKATYGQIAFAPNASSMREVDHLARLAGLDEDARRGAQALADQVVVQPARRQERGDRRALLVQPAVGQDQQRGALRQVLLGLKKDGVERRLQRLAVAVRREEDVQIPRDDFRVLDVRAAGACPPA